MSTKSNKKNFFKTIFTSNTMISGCGSCSCGRPKLGEVFEPTLISKSTPSNTHHHNPNRRPSNTSSSTTVDDHDQECISTTVDDVGDDDDDHGQADPVNNSKIPASPCMKINDSVAVVKDSEDPYGDFKHSMMQMILEKQIDSKEDLEALLKCFMELNSRHHHDVILRAFNEIWNEIFSAGRLSISELTSMCT